MSDDLHFRPVPLSRADRDFLAARQPAAMLVFDDLTPRVTPMSTLQRQLYRHFMPGARRPVWRWTFVYFNRHGECVGMRGPAPVRDHSHYRAVPMRVPDWLDPLGKTEGEIRGEVGVIGHVCAELGADA